MNDIFCIKVQDKVVLLGPQKNKSIKYKGVSKLPKNKYRAMITVNRKTIHLGVFLTEKDAAAAYNQASLQYHKEFGYINDLTS